MCERPEGIAGILIEAGQAVGVKEFRGEEIRDGIDHPEKDRLVQTRIRQDDDDGMSRRAGGHVRVPEADRDATRSSGGTFLRVDQGAVGEQNMKGLAVRAGDHGHGLAQTAEETGFSVMKAVRAEIEIPMGDAVFDLGIGIHESALRVEIQSRPCAGGWETHHENGTVPSIIC